MSLIIIIATIWGISALISHIKQARLAKEQMRQREAQARLLREQRAYAQAQREETARLIALEKARQAQDAWNAKQEAINRKNEERLFKLEQRMASAESELAFNREQRDRLFKLLDIEERERDGAIQESATWQKHQRKVISLENQIHTVQKRIDKAHMDKAYCESKLSA